MKRTKCRPSFRPVVEILEDRLAPTVCTWTGQGNGNWYDPNDWSGGVIANGASDIALFSLLPSGRHPPVIQNADPGGGVVTLAQIQTDSSFASSGGFITITGGLLKIVGTAGFSTVTCPVYINYDGSGSQGAIDVSNGAILRFDRCGGQNLRPRSPRRHLRSRPGVGRTVPGLLPQRPGRSRRG